MYCYANPPEGEFQDDVRASLASSVNLSSSVVLSEADFAHVVANVDSTAVVLTVEYDVPDAVAVYTSCTLPAGRDATPLTEAEVVRRYLDPHFGTGSAVNTKSALLTAALQAAAADSDDDHGTMSAWMSDYLAASACPHHLCWQGEVFSLEDHPPTGMPAQGSIAFSVTRIEPVGGGPVRVSPATEFRVNTAK